MCDEIRKSVLSGIVTRSVYETRWNCLLGFGSIVSRRRRSIRLVFNYREVLALATTDTLIGCRLQGVSNKLKTMVSCMCILLQLLLHNGTCVGDILYD